MKRNLQYPIKRTKKRERLLHKLLDGALKIWQVKPFQRDRTAYIYAIRHARNQKYGNIELNQIKKVLLGDTLYRQDIGLKSLYYDYFLRERNPGTYVWKKQFENEKGESLTEERNAGLDTAIRNEYHLIFVVINASNQYNYTIYGYIIEDDHAFLNHPNEYDHIFSAYVEECPDGIARLVDICCWQENCGIGSKGLDVVKRYVRARGCKEIIGRMF